MIALFDLDDTLLDGDSNHIWGRYLADRGVLDAATHERAQRHYDAQYHGGDIDFREYLRFTLQPLRGRSRAEVEAWQADLAQRHAAAAIFPAARPLLDSHRHRDHTLILVSATNRLFVAPFARALGIADVLASEVEERDGRYTGEPLGEPCYREGKLARFRAWQVTTGREGEETWFYSDSHNDLPLLQQVQHPVAVNPDARLRGSAERHGWPIHWLREKERT